jgi:Ni,Fe-hydrogenase III large subunit
VSGQASASRFATIANGRAIARTAVPELAPDAFRAAVVGAVEDGMRIATLFGMAETDPDAVALVAVLADDYDARLHVCRTRVRSDAFDSITPACPQAHLFEREIAEQFGLRPLGHPWLKPVRFQRSPRRGHEIFGGADGQGPSIGIMDFYRVEGDEVHEVAVGPVHAGVIEPGHFRFQCHGENVFHLEISLGYQHRGVERALVGGPNRRAIHYAETLAGDTTIGHATAFCQVLEGLARCQKTPRAQALRGIALELERLANHVGDLGALANDVAFLPTASFCGRLRGDFLNMTADLCGSRFGRGMVRPGGVGFDVDAAVVTGLLSALDAAERDTADSVELLWNTPSVMARFEDTGPVAAGMAAAFGLVGPAARASGLARDVRHDHPSGAFRFAHIPVSTWNSGDVFGRAYVRWLEIQRSIDFVREQLRSLPPGDVRSPLRALAADHIGVALAEGWRGELCHVGITDAAGRFERYKVVDPSFHNWAGLAVALRGQQISDFPLCNKSFNLSYCGHDL